MQVTETTHASPTRNDPGEQVDVEAWHRRSTFSPDGTRLLTQELALNTFIYNPNPDAAGRLVLPTFRGLSQVRMEAAPGVPEEDWQYYPWLQPAPPIGLMPRYTRAADAVVVSVTDVASGHARLHRLPLNEGRVPETFVENPLNAQDPELLDLSTLWYVMSPAYDELFFLAQVYQADQALFLGLYRLDLSSLEVQRLTRIDETVVIDFGSIDTLEELLSLAQDWSMAVSGDGEHVALAFGGSDSTKLVIAARDGAGTFEKTLPAGMVNLFMDDMTFLDDNRHLALAMSGSGLSFLQMFELGASPAETRQMAPFPIVSRGTPFHRALCLTGRPGNRLLASLLTIAIERTPEEKFETRLYNDIVSIDVVFTEEQYYLKTASAVVRGEGVSLTLDVTVEELMAALQAVMENDDFTQLIAIAQRVGRDLVEAASTMQVRIDLTLSPDGRRAAFSLLDPEALKEVHVWLADLTAQTQDDSPASEIICGFGDAGSEYNTRGNLQAFGTAGDGFPSLKWLTLPWEAYNAANGETHVAMGDVDADGKDEIVIGLGRGGQGWIEIRDDGDHGAVHLAWKRVGWTAYETANGEVWPACGDVDGDGYDEIVIGLGRGGAGWFMVRDDARSGFLPIGVQYVRWYDYNMREGSTRPACGDLDGDGVDEIAIGLGELGKGMVQVFDDLRRLYRPVTWLRVQWTDYTRGLSAPTIPACGNLDGDAADELVVGLGPAAGGALEMKDDLGAGGGTLAWITPRPLALETRPALGDVDGDPQEELVIGYGPGGEGEMYVLDDAIAGFVILGTPGGGEPAYDLANGETFPAVGDVR